MPAAGRNTRILNFIFLVSQGSTAPVLQPDTYRLWINGGLGRELQPLTTSATPKCLTPFQNEYGRYFIFELICNPQPRVAVYISCMVVKIQVQFSYNCLSLESTRDKFNQAKPRG